MYLCVLFLQLANENSIGIKKKVMRSHCLIWTCFDVKPFLSLFWINSCYLIIFFLSSIANKANRLFWIISIHFLIVWGLWMKYFFLNETNQLKCNDRSEMNIKKAHTHYAKQQDYTQDFHFLDIKFKCTISPTFHPNR